MIRNKHISPAARRRFYIFAPRTGAGSDAILTSISTTSYRAWPISRKLKLYRVGIAVAQVPVITTGTAEFFIDNIDKSEAATDVLSSTFDMETLVADQVSFISLLSTVEGGEVFRVLESGDMLVARFVTGTTVATPATQTTIVFEYEFVDDNVDEAVQLGS